MSTDSGKALDEATRADRAEDLVSELVGALEGIASMHAGNPSDAMADIPRADYVESVLQRVRAMARAALRKANEAQP